MTAAELVVVVIGLIAGWFIISAVLARASSRKLREIGLREYSDEDLRASWPALLEASPSSGAEDIRAALETRREALRRSFPAMMTDVEIARYERGIEVLNRAATLAASAALARTPSR